MVIIGDGPEKDTLVTLISKLHLEEQSTFYWISGNSMMNSSLT